MPKWLPKKRPPKHPPRSKSRSLKVAARRNNRISTSRLTVAALLVAVMLVLGRLEAMLPSVGVPGIKLGLSNSILIFSVYMLGIPTSFILMTMKVVLSGMMFGGVQAMVYAFSGGVLSLLVMSILSRFKRISPVIVSMGGGLFHNVGQFAVAMLIMQAPPQMLVYLAVLCAAGLGCGALTGIAARSVMKHPAVARIKPPEAQKKYSRVLAAVAAVLLAAGIFYALRAYLNSRPVTVDTESTGTQLMSPEELLKDPRFSGLTLPEGSASPQP